MTNQASITLNGEDRMTAADNLVALLEEEGIGAMQKGVAIAVNGRVVARTLWPATGVENGDRIELVKVFSGG